MRIRKRVRGKINGNKRKKKRRQNHFQCLHNVLGFELQVLGRSIGVAVVSSATQFRVIRKQSRRLIFNHHLSHNLCPFVVKRRHIRSSVQHKPKLWICVRYSIMAIIYFNIRSLDVIWVVFYRIHFESNSGQTAAD